MQYIDFSSFYTAILTSNLLLAAITLMIRSEKILINAGYKLITIFLVLTVVRFLLPIEVPFATTVPLPQGISSIIIELFAPRFSIGTFDISFIRIICLIWIAGIIVQSYRFVISNRKIRRFVLSCGKDVTNTELYKTALSKITFQFREVRIFEVPGLRTPVIYGNATPYILLPQGMECDEEELVYILKHEISHYKHHDLLIKFGIQLLTTIFWWNPFGYHLNKQISIMLEMRIDDSVTNMDDGEVYRYLATLLTNADDQENPRQDPMANVISLARGDEKILTKRFKMLLEQKRKKNKALNLLLIFIVGSIYVSSYLFSFEADYYTEEALETAFQINMYNSYIIQNNSGTYELYYNNVKIEELDSLDYYYDIPVYTWEDFDNVQ